MDTKPSVSMGTSSRLAGPIDVGMMNKFHLENDASTGSKTTGASSITVASSISNSSMKYAKNRGAYASNGT